MQRAKAHRWGRLAALIAGLAILLQAAATPPVRAEVMEVCTAHGVQKILKAADEPAQAGDCGHCGHCVLTAASDFADARLDAPVRYAAALAIAPATPRTQNRGARAPPRPPGQGPPAA
jgi:hypothetical protein